MNHHDLHDTAYQVADTHWTANSEGVRERYHVFTAYFYYILSRMKAQQDSGETVTDQPDRNDIDLLVEEHERLRKEQVRKYGEPI